MTFSPLSQKLYQTLLQSKKPLTAINLAAKLDVLPNTIYRLAEPLLKMGLITKSKNYPHQFTTKPIEEGLALFLLQQNSWFSQTFSQLNSKIDQEKQKEIPQHQQISFSFIQSRDELMKLSENEVSKTTTSVDLLRSGHEIPADLMLALIESIKRGVQIRMLIQDYSDENCNQVANWQKNGILVRKTPLRHIRLMIYDHDIVYFMSYKHTDSGKDIGMKITYPPFAIILFQLFEQWWDQAEKIAKA